MEKRRYWLFVLSLVVISVLLLAGSMMADFVSNRPITGKVIEFNELQFSDSSESSDELGESEDEGPSSEVGSGSGGFPYLTGTYKIPRGTSAQINNVVVSAGGSDFTASGVRSSIDGTILRGSLTVMADSDGGAVEVTLNHISNVRVTNSEGMPVEFRLESDEPGFFIGISSARTQRVVIDDPIPEQNYRIEFESPSISTSSSEIRAIENNELIGTRITVDNPYSPVEDVLMVTTLDVDEDFSERDLPLVRVFRRSDAGIVEVIEPNPFLDRENGNVWVGYRANLERGRNSFDIVVRPGVDSGSRVVNTVRTTRFGEIPLATEVPASCRPLEGTEPRRISRCKVGNSDASLIISNSEVFRLERERIVPVTESVNDCPLEVKYVETCPGTEVIVSDEPEVFFSPDDGKPGLSLKVMDEGSSIVTTLSISEETVDINFESSLPAEVRNSPVVEEGSEINYRYFAFGLWGLFVVVLPLVFFSFRDKEVATINSLISSVRSSVRREERKTAYDQYFLLEKMYDGLSLKKKAKVADKFNECSRMLKENFK